MVLICASVTQVWKGYRIEHGSDFLKLTFTQVWNGYLNGHWSNLLSWWCNMHSVGISVIVSYLSDY